MPKGVLEVAEFERFYREDGLILVRFRTVIGGKIRILRMTPEVMRHGVANAMGFIGGNVICMAKRVVREQRTG